MVVVFFAYIKKSDFEYEIRKVKRKESCDMWPSNFNPSQVQLELQLPHFHNLNKIMSIISDRITLAS